MRTLAITLPLLALGAAGCTLAHVDLDITDASAGLSEELGEPLVEITHLQSFR